MEQKLTPRPYGQNIQTHCSLKGYASTHDACLTLNFIARSPILMIHVSRLGRGERGMDWKTLLGSLSESVDEELRLRNGIVNLSRLILSSGKRICYLVLPTA